MILRRRKFLGFLSSIPALRHLWSARTASSAPSTASQPVGSEAAPERFSIDYGRFLRQHELFYEKLVLNPAHGLIIGNGDIGAILWQDYNIIRLGLSKNDVWDRRYPPDDADYQEPTQAQFIEGVHKLSEGKKPFTQRHLASSAYPFPDTQITLPMERWQQRVYGDVPYPIPKPCGSLLFQFPRTSDAMRLKQRLSLYNASLLLELESGPARVRMEILAHARQNVFLVSLENEGQDSFDLILDLQRSGDRTDETMTAPTFGSDGDFFRSGTGFLLTAPTDKGSNMW